MVAVALGGAGRWSSDEGGEPMSRRMLLLTGLLVLALPGRANAQVDRDCGNFAFQEDAQAYFVSRGGSPSNNVDDLDRDHDGVACQNLPRRGTSASTGSTTTTSATTTATQSANPCLAYSSQSRAQTAFNSDRANLSVLDSDGDGRACEILGVRRASTRTSTLPRNGAPIWLYAMLGLTLLELGAGLRLVEAHVLRPLPHRRRPDRWETR